MLKLLYKTLLVSVLSGSLLLLDFSYKGLVVNSAMAESVKTEKIDDSDLMGTLTMTVVGVLAKRMYTYKPTADILLGAAGGLIFLAGEVTAFVGLKDVLKGMEEQITRDKAGNVNKEQIESLERLKKTYVEAKKTANTKKMLQMAAAAAFAAAAATAYTMSAGDLAALSTCTAGISTGLAAEKVVKAICKGYSSNPATAAKAPPCEAELVACTTAVKTYQESVMSYELDRQSIGPSIPLLTKAVATEATLSSQLKSMSLICLTDSSIMALPVKPACSPLVPNNQKGESSGNMIVEANAMQSYKEIPSVYKKIFAANGINEKIINELAKKEQQKSSEGFLSKTIDFILPKANAELFSAMGIASSMAVSFLLATSATLGPSIDMYMLIPQNRAIVWGILSGLTFAATTSTNNVIAKIDSNIKKIDEILKSMYSMADGATGSNIATTATPASQSSLKPSINSAPNAVNYESIDLSNGINGTLPCGTGEEGQKCKSFEDSLKDLPSYAGLNAESQSQLSSIMKTASGMSGTSIISSGTLNSASKLASQSNALRAAMNKAKSATVAGLKKSGSKVDIDAESKKLSDLLEKGVKDNLKKKNTDAAGMLASLSGGKFGGGSATTNSSASDDAAKKAEADALAAALAKSKAGSGVNVINLNSGSSDSMDLGLTGVDNGSNGQMSAEELAAYNLAAKKAATDIDEYEIKNDISKDTGANLFELISNRYQQSGYPRLFKLKEAEPDTIQAIKN